MAKRSTFCVAVCTTSLFCASVTAEKAAPTPLPPSVIASRAEAMILAGFIADAAAMPLHWIYDVTEIARLVGTGNPEFFNPPSCPFYSYPPKSSTPYGQQSVAHLTVAATTGSFAPTQVETAYYNIYKAGGVARQNSWYYDASTKEFVSNEENGNHWPSCGGNDNQADALAHMISVVALYGGNTSKMLSVADTVIRVTQNTNDACAFGLGGARILENILVYNMTGYEAVEAAMISMQDPNRAQPYSEDLDLAQGLQRMLSEVNMSNMDVVMAEGQSCDYPHNLLTGAHLIAQLGATEEDYVNGIRQTILAGGDSGSRGFFVGAAVGAQMGSVNALPSSWAAKTGVYSTIAPLAAQVVGYRQTI